MAVGASCPVSHASLLSTFPGGQLPPTPQSSRTAVEGRGGGVLDVQERSGVANGSEPHFSSGGTLGARWVSGDPAAFAPLALPPSPEPSPFQGIGGRTWVPR